MNMAGEKGRHRKRKPATKPDNPAQSKGFIETAKAVCADESGDAFDKAMKSLLKPRKPKG